MNDIYYEPEELIDRNDPLSNLLKMEEDLGLNVFFNKYGELIMFLLDFKDEAKQACLYHNEPNKYTLLDSIKGFVAYSCVYSIFNLYSMIRTRTKQIEELQQHDNQEDNDVQKLISDYSEDIKRYEMSIDYYASIFNLFVGAVSEIDNLHPKKIISSILSQEFRKENYELGIDKMDVMKSALEIKDEKFIKDIVSQYSKDSETQFLKQQSVFKEVHSNVLNTLSKKTINTETLDTDEIDLQTNEKYLFTIIYKLISKFEDKISQFKCKSASLMFSPKPEPAKHVKGNLLICDDLLNKVRNWVLENEDKYNHVVNNEEFMAESK